MHKRSLIRAAAVAALEAEIERLGSSMLVFESRTEKDFVASELPACTVVTSSEDIEADKLKVDLEDKQRALLLTIGVYSGAPTEKELAALVDAMAVVVESAIEKDSSLGGNATTAHYAGFDLEKSDQGNSYRGAGILRYLVIYSYAPDPDQSDVAPLLSAGVEWNLSAAQAEADRLKDTIPVEQAP